jgi:hypothetical protein
MTDPPKQTIAELEAELKEKQRQLKEKFESPFAEVSAAPVDAPKRGRPPKQEADPEATKSNAIAAYGQRMAGIKRPAPDSSSESVRDWAEKEIHNLLPEAVASLAWDIKYGDAKARTEARGEILRATGVDKRDATNFGKGGQIVINVGGANGGIALPWLQRTEPQPSSPVVQTLVPDKKKKEEE